MRGQHHGAPPRRPPQIAQEIGLGRRIQAGGGFVQHQHPPATAGPAPGTAAAPARPTAASRSRRPMHPARRADRARNRPGARHPARATARLRPPRGRRSADWCAACPGTPARPATAARCAGASRPARNRARRVRHSAPGRPADLPVAGSDAAAWTCPRRSPLDRHALARRDAQADAVQHQGAIGIGEAQAVQFQRAIRRQRGRRVGIAHVRLALRHSRMRCAADTAEPRRDAPRMMGAATSNMPMTASSRPASKGPDRPPPSCSPSPNHNTPSTAAPAAACRNQSPRAATQGGPGAPARSARTGARNARGSAPAHAGPPCRRGRPPRPAPPRAGRPRFPARRRRACARALQAPGREHAGHQQRQREHQRRSRYPVAQHRRHDGAGQQRGQRRQHEQEHSIQRVHVAGHARHQIAAAIGASWRGVRRISARNTSVRRSASRRSVAECPARRSA